ncbi:hypothetical protein CKM354_000657400 [Cercospora kikuchii]|uniref:non-specific serine/threonine protein kinase n=1 Tax=Cercospora kikuchii TaxID=84275 RepID=A0A9P3CL18_9PEZI|nr:uncharacterized protein CKM354_000657400 [Cercospora kikuchii]GIZ43342.1 hypothetical protein CKM354_000657400 [Cercospora kikuchii]
MMNASEAQDSSTHEPEYYGPDTLLEEESFSWYDRRAFYPVRIGEIFESKYEILLKLGYGSVSTAWLCRNLETQQYVTFKIYMTGHRQAQNEVKVLQHIQDVGSDNHPGSQLVRRMLDTFELPGEMGSHTCIVHTPLSLTMRDIRNMAGGQIPSSILKPLVYGLLVALEYLHSEAHVVHTDIQECNIMLSIDDHSFLDELVEQEREQPSPRKHAGDRTIYSTVELDMPDEPGDATICDFGDAKFGQAPFEGEVMPDLYRAPEIVLGIPWNEKIDIWSFGLMIWDLLEGKHIFTERLPSREGSSGKHLARMVALLGNPPSDFLQRSRISNEYFDDEGNPKIQGTPETTTTTLEEEESILEGEEKSQFVVFMKKTLHWRPEDRASAKDLLQDPWVVSWAA